MRYALLCLLLPSIAAAQERPATAVAPFEGRLAPTMRRAVERALEEQAAVIDADQVREAAEEHEVSGLEVEGVPELARAVGARLVVQGNVRGSRRSQTIDLVVRGADGRELARGSAPYRRGRRFAARFERAVRRVFAEALDAMPAGGSEPIERDEAPPPIDEEPERPPSVLPADGLALATIHAFVTLRGRSARIDFASSAPRIYESGPYPELGLALELRPFANDSHLGRGIFVNAAFAHSVGLGSSVDSPECMAMPNMAGCQVGTNFARFMAGAGFLGPIGDVVELGAGLWGGFDGYYLGTNTVLPTAEYAFVRPAVRGRIRLMQETIVIDAEVAYRGVVGVGDLAAAFGSGWGAHGVDVGAGLGGNLLVAAGLGFSWAVRFEYVGYFLTFSDAAMDEQAESGGESAFRLAVMAGWSFR